MGYVYILHFDQALGGRVLHYIGYTSKGIRARIASHRETTWEPYPQPVVSADGKVTRGRKIGPGATIMGVVNSLGIGWSVARTFRNVNRAFERALKNTKKVRVYCPICEKQPRDYHPKEKS